MAILTALAFVIIANRYRGSVLDVQDFANLTRFHEANANLKFNPDVVFIGDSITAYWKLETDFPGKRYLNRGIARQTGSQVLLRMHQDVVDLHPRAVVIQVGTNDLAGTMGNVTLEQIEANYKAMYEVASSNGVRVVFASLLPVSEYPISARLRHMLTLRPPEKIIKLNSWLRGFCDAHGLIFLDYYAAVVDEHGLFKREFSSDGLHPNLQGYAAMDKVLNDSHL